MNSDFLNDSLSGHYPSTAKINELFSIVGDLSWIHRDEAIGIAKDNSSYLLLFWNNSVKSYRVVKNLINGGRNKEILFMFDCENMKLAKKCDDQRSEYSIISGYRYWSDYSQVSPKIACLELAQLLVKLHNRKSKIKSNIQSIERLNINSFRDQIVCTVMEHSVSKKWALSTVAEILNRIESNTANLNIELSLLNCEAKSIYYDASGKSYFLNPTRIYKSYEGLDVATAILSAFSYGLSYPWDLLKHYMNSIKIDIAVAEALSSLMVFRLLKNLVDAYSLNGSIQASERPLIETTLEFALGLEIFEEKIQEILSKKALA